MTDLHQTTQSCETPTHIRGASVTDSIAAINKPFSNANDDSEPDPKRAKNLKITPEQLSQLIHACSTPAATSGSVSRLSPSLPTTTPTSVTTLAYVQNAKYEEICCRPIKPAYEGSEDDLMPFLLRLDI
jgi:hypothetical protein